MRKQQPASSEEKKLRALAVLGKAKGSGSRSGRKAGKASAQSSQAKSPFLTAGVKISDFYRPLKKPVTIRIDADVLAWFQKDGNRYQTRINLALRKVMEREMKQS
ncbi:MAG TPA: BrnA antitoxin family protein [Candidatus Sulfotelmatobacter sp.]|jgi:uncharacterized protein (DUF4415 family)|nr:BrnA antitoxin family protein [Candidatus Sulfotelmatobacter sp.]